MSRNMIFANIEVFRLLDAFCEFREQPIKNAARPRWIATNAADRKILKQAILSGVLAFGPGRSIARLDRGSTCYICTIGFDHVGPQAGLVEIDLEAGILTTVLAEVKPRPRASPAQVKDVVEAFDKHSTPNYIGHDSQLIASLFPPIKVFSAVDVTEDETWRIFFLLCLDEIGQGETWIREPFVRTLQAIAELEVPNVPYRTLCRSIFDADPATMFLALYRCLESLYAYSSAKNIIDALDLSNEWSEVAIVLEDQLGWHPREESSLTDLLSMANRGDLEAIFTSIGTDLPGQADLSHAAARLIYKVRNDLVHFRPIHHRLDYTKMEWNQLCTAMATLVWELYSEVFPAPR